MSRISRFCLGAEIHVFLCCLCWPPVLGGSGTQSIRAARTIGVGLACCREGPLQHFPRRWLHRPKGPAVSHRAPAVFVRATGRTISRWRRGVAGEPSDLAPLSGGHRQARLQDRRWGSPPRWLPVAQVADSKQPVSGRSSWSSCGVTLLPVISGTQPSCNAHAPRQPRRPLHEAHKASGHVRYRSWCEVCFTTRGIGSQHRQRGDGARCGGAAPTQIYHDGLDCVPDDGDCIGSSEQMTALVSTGKLRGPHGALVELQKGADERALKCAQMAVELHGHRRAGLKPEGQSAMRLFEKALGQS